MRVASLQIANLVIDELKCSRKNRIQSSNIPTVPPKFVFRNFVDSIAKSVGFDYENIVAVPHKFCRRCVSF